MNKSIKKNMTGELNNHLMFVLKVQQKTFLLVYLIATRWSGGHRPHFIGNRTEAQRSELTNPVSHSLGEAEPGFKLKPGSCPSLCSS